tara:strand:- start:2635 stop:2859 length:225 start_codon:yes stop_codon:yes gene_type:complete
LSLAALVNLDIAKVDCQRQTHQQKLKFLYTHSVTYRQSLKYSCTDNNDMTRVFVKEHRVKAHYKEVKKKLKKKI